MRRRASIALRCWTAGLAVTIAALMGVHFAGGLVPAAWMVGGYSTHVFELNYTDPQGRDVAEPLVLTIRDDMIGGVVVSSWLAASYGEPKFVAGSNAGAVQSKAQAEAAFLASMALAPSIRSDMALLVPLAVASPGARTELRYRERLAGAYLMRFRSGFGLNQNTFCTWAIALPAWVVVLWVKWWRVLRSRQPGLCRACGYDRAGLVGGAVCPECGTASGDGAKA